MRALVRLVSAALLLAACALQPARGEDLECSSTADCLALGGEQQCWDCADYEGIGRKCYQNDSPCQTAAGAAGRCDPDKVACVVSPAEPLPPF